MTLLLGQNVAVSIAAMTWALDPARFLAAWCVCFRSTAAPDRRGGRIVRFQPVSGRHSRAVALPERATYWLLADSP
jgi:hypothetical protein